MKDLYLILGITKEASAQEIKRAYRKLALDAHPDKGGDQKTMGLLNEAYATLSDSDERRRFDANWNAFIEADVTQESHVVFDGYLQAANAIPYSQEFRAQHQSLVKQYAQKPLRNNAIDNHLPSFESGIYSVEGEEGTRRKYHDIYTFIQAKTSHHAGVPCPAPTQAITPVIATQLFTNFLSGAYYGKDYPLCVMSNSSPIKKGVLYLKNLGINGVEYTVKHNDNGPIISGTINPEMLASLGILVPLPVHSLIKTFNPRKADILNITAQRGHAYPSNLIAVKKYLAGEIDKIRLRNPNAPELSFYEGIYEIIQLTDKTASEHDGLIFSIKKITDFAKKSSDLLLPSLIPLFYNKFFRNLHAYALHVHWDSSENLFDAGNLNQFDGYKEAKELLDVLKDRLSSNRDEHLSQLIQYIKLMFYFEKDKHEKSLKSQSAADFREAAFHFLDWLPVFIDQSSRQIIANLFLQIGIKFQQASRVESRPEIKMADERLAFKMYLTAAEIGHKTTPDVGIYANTQAIKYISAFRFQDEMQSEILCALKKRTLNAADIFPFFDAPQSNVAYVRQANNTLHLMRQLLNTIVNAYEYNKTHSDSISIDHSAVKILYQAYEACLKNWYQEEFDPAVEQKFRLNLMEELLFDNGWTFLDVEQLVASPWIMVDRDEQGWMRPTRSLPYTEEDAFVKYRTINGAEINNKTGEINFFMTPWTQGRPVYEKIFTLFDLQEMLEKNITGAIFSLDPVDPDMEYHPYNLMRFTPSQLCDSELLNTMLLTDYILKFMTTNQEINGLYPFEQKPVASMLQHLPAYLRKIIEDFHAEQHSGALHRFWIEAEEIDISIDEASSNEEITKMALGSLKMMVKKHRMERDINGELKDVGNEDEGWPIYVLTPEQMQELEQGKRVINDHAMIYIYGKAQLFYWENNAILHSHTPKDYRETLIRLFLQPRNKDGKVEQTTKNMPLIYRSTKEMANQSGTSHRYSPEFIFAHEFTTHYDEFAQYLPEFGRLKELSKMSALIRILSNIRQSNQESLDALTFLLNPLPQGASPSTNAYRDYNQAYQEVCKKITSEFQRLRGELSTSVLKQEQLVNLRKIKEQIEPLTFNEHSKEVAEHRNRWHNELKKQYPHISSWRLWDEIPSRAKIAKDLSDSKWNAVRGQLMEAFSTCSSSSIDSFMRGDMDSLANELIAKAKINIQQEVHKQFPNRSKQDIALAIDDDGNAAAMRIATEEARDQLRQIKALKDKQESGFAQINMGKEEQPVDLEGKCFWVPASVRHDVKKEDTTGLTRYSFFVYGGVNIQPRINVVQGRNGALGGSSIGGGAFNRNQITKGYQYHHIASNKNKFTKNHELWKLSGVNIDSRVNKIHLPKTAEQHQTRSVHSGRHTNAYSVDVAKKMQQVADQGKDAGWTPSQYRQATRNLLSEIRQELRAGSIALNKNYRPWAK